MVGYYDEIEIEDMTWDEEAKVYHYPCPCGDRFEISRAQLATCEDIATCPSCSLIIRVIYDPVRSIPLIHLLGLSSKTLTCALTHLSVGF
jgi:diphthamide biosynthesis protein 3